MPYLVSVVRYVRMRYSSTRLSTLSCTVRTGRVAALNTLQTNVTMRHVTIHSVHVHIRTYVEQKFTCMYIDRSTVCAAAGTKQRG